jgi:hypothetical protein
MEKMMAQKGDSKELPFSSNSKESEMRKEISKTVEQARQAHIKTDTKQVLNVNDKKPDTRY